MLKDFAPAEAAPLALPAAFREGGRPLMLVLAFALLLRVAYVGDFLLHHPLAGTPISDAALHDAQARAIAAGDFLGPAEPFHHPPLYPYSLALVYAVAGPHPAAMVALQSALGLLALLVLYAVVRAFASRGVALALLVAATLWRPMLHYETRLLAESLAMLALALALHALLRARGSGGWLAAGIWLGALAALRPEHLLTIALVAPAALLARSGRGALTHTDRGARARAGIALLLGVALPILPFFLRNLVHGGEPVLLCDSGGVNLWFANQPGAGASFRTSDARFGEVATQAATARALAQAETGAPMAWGEVSAFFRDRALRYALEHPLDELALLARRARAFVADFEYCIVYCPESERDLGASRLLFFPGALVVAAALAGVLGVLGGLRRDRRAWVLAAVVVAQLAATLLFFQYSRFRLVLLPALLPLAAILLRSRPRAPELAVLALLLVAAFWPPPAEAREQEAIGRIALADGFVAQGDLARAEDELDRAERLAPRSSRLLASRQSFRLARGDAAGARELLESSLAANRAQPVTLALLSELLSSQPAVRDVSRSEALAREALALAPDSLAAHLALGHALLQQSRFADLAAAMAVASRLPGAPAEVFALRGAALRRTGSRAEAEQSLRRALEIDPRHVNALREMELLRRE